MQRYGFIAAVVMTAIAQLHGTVTKIDPARHTFWIHHDPFAQMPMAMTMEVQPVRAADLGKLHVGERITVTVDTSVVPWPGKNIRPAAK
jgi:Cu/Ag efflux protein CusF